MIDHVSIIEKYSVYQEAFKFQSCFDLIFFCSNDFFLETFYFYCHI